MCDVCSDFIQLLVSYESQVCREQQNEQPTLSPQEVDVVYGYIQSWPGRQCMCCYRDLKNLDRFSHVTQGIIYMTVCQLKKLSEKEEDVEKNKEKVEKPPPPKDGANPPPPPPDILELDKLLLLAGKIFVLNFPLYVAYKHCIQAKLDDVGQQDLQALNMFCDLHDQEIPVYLLKNVSSFCKMGGILAMTACFTQLSPELLPIATAHSMIAVVGNLKLWMNYKSMVSMLVPLRSCVLRYMCKLSDQDLRAPSIKGMADFMWNAIKDPLDTPVAFDIDGLDLAFKYFISSTLTMRLAGITQINNQIGVLAEVCVGENLQEGDPAPHHMADWLINNNIISHIFGPNLHVEVIKQSHIVLNFLAMEGRITCEHMDVIWAAAQLKHCSKPVHDLLPGLVKHLAAVPTLHLYSLLTKLDPKDHTEQTLYLASALIKSVWSRGGGGGTAGVTEVGLINVAASNAGITLHKCTTSSENSVSIDPSNSEEEHGESTGQSESHKSDSEDIDGVEIDEEDAAMAADSSGPPPCKLARKQGMGRVHCGNAASSSDPEVDGIPIKSSTSEKPKRCVVSAKTKLDKRQMSSVRKKLLSNLTVLPEGIEAIGSSSSQDEGDVDGPSKFRKRRKMLRKTRVKRQKGVHKPAVSMSGMEAMSEVEVDSESDLKVALKSVGGQALVLPAQMSGLVEANLKPDYIDESSSCSELGKESVHLEGHEGACTNFLTLHARGSHILEMLSGEEAEVEGDADGSYSSRMSNKSEKNMADFDGEDSVCEEELAQLAENAQMKLHALANQSSPEKSPIRVDPRLSACFKADNVCQPGNTLLWDLLQDDKICHLGEGLALEAEKTLCNLICYTPDKQIRMKFIEGCLHNLANNMSVVVSLKMLPKLLSSFRGIDMHHVTHWAERQHHMMKHFFNNLRTYTANPAKSLSLYTHLMQVQVRLHFLSAVFSPVVSPNSFKLSIDQVDILWECLAHDTECSDELFSWLLSQTKATEMHALKMEALKRLYMHHLPSLAPEKFSMICLSLFQQLCSLNNLFIGLGSESAKESYGVGMDHMWKIALRANNTDVSMSAIQYINSYYMGQNLQNEGQFVWQCMTHLKAATEDLVAAKGPGSEEAALLCIQRALLLMKSHLETFKRRYAYHLRRWTLEGKGIGSHSSSSADRTGSPMRLVVQAGSTQDRSYFDLMSSDYVADLRAELVKWAEVKSQEEPSQGQSHQPKINDAWMRIITQGQELTIDCDEKTLAEMGFKDNQMIYISFGMSRNMKKRDCGDLPSMQPAPPRDSIPTLLLLRPNYFEQLFSLMDTLSSMKIQVKGGRHMPHTKAQVLSRRVWEILSLLPTSPTLLQGFKELNIPLSELLDPSSAQKLMYSLYIVDSLSHKNLSSKAGEEKEPWCRTFIQNGGLRHLFDIFTSGVLQRDGGNGSEWQQDCLASLLRILCQLGVELLPIESRPSRTEKILIPPLNEAMLSMIDVKVIMPQLTSILEEASLPKDPNHYKTGFWGRAQVVHYAMSLLVSWLHCSEEARQVLFQSDNFSVWLRRLVLEDPEPAVRREVCSAIYRLCLGVPASGDLLESSLVAPVLSELLQYLGKAESMRPQKLDPMSAPEEGKEPYGPACRDYFWLVARLIDSLPDDLVKESLEEESNSSIDINALTIKISNSLLSREFLETRHRTVDDDGLIGLINLLTNLVKHRPPFQGSKQGHELLNEVFDFLFALPNPKQRYVPKCKSIRSRTAAYDLLVELVKGFPQNYYLLHEKLLKQHQPGPHSPYPWDYWPHEDGRSDCGYVGLTNLGATCYMASCMQHLYMMPQARASILSAVCSDGCKYEPTLKELQRMFAYLLESERKAYNPRSFCKVYTMDHQPLNTAEQKDMAEFFIDLVSKLEEMSPALKAVIKKLFCGVISNNVVSLDCDHVSRNVEEFYTVRCQVADMRNLYESLDEVTVKDTLEGDNMYTCSQCNTKVRAEKRACFKKLPQILCFNTMRYTFNMLTMLKEKVNTHFSFPLRLNMAGYVEKQLMPQHYQEDKLKNDPEMEQYDYDLIGVTVHTGTADGGHYYSFIKDRITRERDKWFLFNDAEVKPFDPSQIAAECFGGEMTSKTYDSVTDKFMDFSFEKTNSAYMLFYERCPVPQSETSESPSTTAAESVDSNSNGGLPSSSVQFELSKELEDWIWQDNMYFIQDKNIFEHTYFNFMWQLCGYIPQTILPIEPDVTQKAAQLSTSFFIETFIHAKEKPTMVQWVELVTKQFNACQEACVWFLEHMANDTWWPVQVLLKCPNQMVRQMFQRLCIHVIQRLKQSHSSLYLEVDPDCYSDTDNKDSAAGEPPAATKIGNASCVTKFIKTLLSLMEHGAKAHLKHLTEYFGFLYEFSKMGEEESKFLLAVGAINLMVNFYLGHKATEFVEVSEGEEEEEVAMPTDKYKPASLDKMITLVASLVEKSRDSNMKLQLSSKDYAAVAEGKGFPFLYQQIKDNINLQQTRNLIHSLCRGNNSLAQSIIGMVSNAISRHSDTCQPFFKILTLLTEGGGQGAGSSSSQPCFTQLVLQKVWEAAECCPYSALDWLALQVTRNRLVHQWVLSSMEQWLEHFLVANANQRVRNAAGYLVVSLVPSQQFRQGFRGASHHRVHREHQLSNEAQVVLHQVYTTLLRLLPTVKHYTDMATHGTMKLTTYFSLLTHCCISRTEKLMFGQHFIQLWHLFHPKLSEPSIPAYHNKQAVLQFWNHVCTECPENVQLMLQNAHVTKNIAFNYILADHDDQEIVVFNRQMLPAYYGLLRMMCQQSRIFTRHLAQHQNLQWAFKNITPHPTQYTLAVEELFKLMQLMVMKHPEATEVEQREICSFRRTTLMTYLQCLDGRTSWGTLISAFKILLESNDDKLYVVYNGGLQIVFECFQNLHVMLHEATACHVSGDLLDILSIMQDLVRCVRNYRDNKDSRGLLLATKDWLEVIRKLSTLLNTYNPPEMRSLCIDVLKEFVLIMAPEAMQILVPLLSHCHSAFQDTHDAVPLGPYFPRRGHSLPVVAGKGGARPLRPMVQMTVPHNQLECGRGIDPEYDEALDKYYAPYHDFIDMLFRMAVNNETVTDNLVNLSAVVGFEAVPLHSTYFPKLWLDILNAQHIDRKYITMLTACNYFVDYIDAVLLDERAALTVNVIYEFLTAFFPKVSSHVLSEQTLTMFDNTVVQMSETAATMDILKSFKRLVGDLRALILVHNSPEAVPPPLLRSTMKQLQCRVKAEIAKIDCKADKAKEPSSESAEPKTSESQQPSTSDDASCSKPKSDTGKPEKSDSDSETQNTSCSEDSADEKTKKGPLEELNLLDTLLTELLAISDRKA